VLSRRSTEIRQLDNARTFSENRKSTWPEGRTDPSVAEAVLVSTASGQLNSEENNSLREAYLPRKACSRAEPKFGLSCALAQEPLHVRAQLRKENTLAEAFVNSLL
jgi:tellurite resistance protein